MQSSEHTCRETQISSISDYNHRMYCLLSTSLWGSKTLHIRLTSDTNSFHRGVDIYIYIYIYIYSSDRTVQICMITFMQLYIKSNDKLNVTSRQKY